MQVLLLVILATVTGSSDRYECVDEYVRGIDQDVIHSIEEIDGLDEFMVSPARDSIAEGIAKRCPEASDMLNALGVHQPENQLSVLAQASFLAIKYDGDLRTFIDYLAGEYSRWEENAASHPDAENTSCDEDFQLIGNRIQVWTPGQLIFRSYSVGYCGSDGTFWLFKAEAGWRTLDPYEKAEICTTMTLQGSRELGYCSQSRK